jgi:hypothetical protein
MLPQRQGRPFQASVHYRTDSGAQAGEHVIMRHVNGSNRGPRPARAALRPFPVQAPPPGAHAATNDTIVLAGELGRCAKCGGDHARVIGRSPERPVLYFRCDRCGCLSVGPA